ncbi:copper amine oxidase N-terminal domain-containing protein [Brevibacillus sp. H7]|uniref:copper amine oxidase N-terminal domain-containing protein n=1 Tax=Brevibacillus sp. H7 TaxID=3349138 RepID=UPI0038275185
MEKGKKVLPIMLASALVSTPFVAAPQAYAVSDLAVDMDDDTADKTTDYTIDFTLEEDLDAGEEIIITFDDEFDLSDIDEDYDVEVDGEDIDDVSVDTDDNTITITLKDDLSKDDDVTISIYNVVNPDEEDKYEIEVETENEDSDTDEVSIYEDDDDDDDDDEEFSVDIGDDEEDVETDYFLGPIELETDLEEGEWVTVIFPDEDMVPSRIDTEDVEINGYEVDDIDINGDEVELKIPEDADGDDELEIEFLKSAGITNPGADDDYTIEVEYDGDTYYSEEFEITEGSGSGSADSDFTVSLSDTTAGARSSYTFEADFGSKKLYGGDDVIVEFPSSEMLPGVWSASDVTINGKAAKNVYSSGNKVYVTAPSGFTSDSEVKVSFSYTAWVTNPKTAGDYTLKMTVDGKTITSKSFKITGATYTPPTTPATPVPVDNSTATIGLTNPALNTATGVNVAIKGVSVPLVKQRDFIELVFPVGYRVPAYITPANVTVNGVMANYVAVRGQNVLIYPSQDIPAATAANVVISPAANIVNPAVKNAYSISVFTSEEKGLLFARAVSVGGAPTAPPAVSVPANAALIKVNVASFTLHGKTYPLQAAPTIVNSTTVVPAQFFKEALALTTQWNNQTVAIISGTKVLRFTVGSNKAKVGAQEVTLPTAVTMKNNMPMIPIKFVADNLGYKVGWDAKTSSVFIYR